MLVSTKPAAGMDFVARNFFADAKTFHLPKQRLHLRACGSNALFFQAVAFEEAANNFADRSVVDRSLDAGATIHLFGNGNCNVFQVSQYRTENSVTGRRTIGYAVSLETSPM